MPRTITIKGIGRVSTLPDYVVITMNLETKEFEYEETMKMASRKIEHQIGRAHV